MHSIPLSRRRSLRPFLVIVAACGLVACGPEGTGEEPAAGTANPMTEPAGPTAADFAAAIDHPARPEEDRARDADRKPGEVLAFFGIRPGMRVADMMAGTGYYTEILARVVGPEGEVYAHNNPYVTERFAEGPMSERLAKPGMENVTRITSEWYEPGLPGDLDAVLLIRFYHDFIWMGGDRAAFNRAVFDALKPGGVFGVIDHRAEPGSGERDSETLHRIDAEMVKNEILAAGFVLEAESDILTDPEDTLDWFLYVDDGARRDKTSRFVYRFRKPEEM